VCLRLISPGGIGRIAYSGRSGVTVLPVSYRLHQGAIVFRTAQDSPLEEDLRTGIADAEYKVGSEIDGFDLCRARKLERNQRPGRCRCQADRARSPTGVACRVDELAETLGVSCLRQPLSARPPAI
jgi:hypothetical protein